MAQVTHGLRAILSASVAYDMFQNLVGAESCRRRIADEYLAVGSGSSVLDIGCGTAEILKHLPEDIQYVGFDASQAYVKAAQARFSNRGSFFAGLVTAARLDALPKFDLIMALGVVHHLSDTEADHLFALAARAVKAEGRLVTVDCCIAPKQSPVARAMIRWDRGQNVRQLAGYRRLAASHFTTVTAVRRADLFRIPYTHAILSCSSAEPVETG